MKWKLLGAAAVAVVASSWAVSSAMAAPIPRFEPLTTNIPYLAWRGEELRLVKCATDQNDGRELTALLKSDSDGSRRFDADWLVEDWSGAFFQPPQLEKSTVKFFRGNNEYDDAPCVKADFVSLKAGLAQIKLVITDTRTGNPVIKHQFLAGWLGLNTPTIRELGATSTPGGGGTLGDPAGDGIFNAGGAPGRVQVHVTGNLPLGNNFSELGLGTSINLPTETDGSTRWDDLARAMATTSDFRPFYRDAPWRMWDIHDDRATTTGHVTNALCGPPTTLSIDAVDACLGAELFIGDGEYSRAFGDLSATPTFGPFDPLRPDETLLPDGKLDEGDVPMPSANVEIGIAPNSGSPTDISGVGSLAITAHFPPPEGDQWIGVFKCIPYSRDHKCTSNGAPPDRVHPNTTPQVSGPPFGPAAHNHYAPYYSRWQPATYATVGSSLDNDARVAREASGNDGPAIGNNFPGYRGSGLYDYWQFIDVLSIAEDGPTKCLRRLKEIDYKLVPQYRRLPEGPQRVMVFSDEHGEAQVWFNPGLGFFFDNLGVIPNANGGCDLRGITTLGTADISAIARYPYQKVTDPDKASTSIRKTVRSLFRKDVVCVPKGPVPPLENSLAFICTATAIDIDGTPFAHEKVCFMTGAPSEGMRSFPLGTPSKEEGLGRLCVWTDANGQARVEVFGKCGTGNVIVEFVHEGIIRFTTFTFGCPTTPPTTTTTTTVGTTTGTTTAPAAGSATALTPAAPAAVINTIIKEVLAASSSKASSTPTTKPSKSTLALVRIQKKAFAAKSDRYVVVRVNGKARTARIQVTLIAKSGKVVGKVTRAVPTNRVTRVPNLKLPGAVVNARVKVLT